MEVLKKLEKVFGKPRWWRWSFRSLFLLNLAIYYFVLILLFLLNIINIYILIDLIISPHILLLFIYYTLSSRSHFGRVLYWITIGLGVVSAPLFFLIPIISITLYPSLTGSTKLLIYTIIISFTLGPISGYMMGKKRNFRKIKEI